MNNSSKNDIIIKCTNISKNYVTNEITVQALRNINLTISTGEFVSIMGPSGCGKTTLLNLIGGLDQPSAGEIEIECNNIAHMTENELAEMRKYKIGFVFQTYNLLPIITAIENVELPMIIANNTFQYRKTRAQQLLEVVGLKDRQYNKPDNLSGGEKQRVAIARALANNPSILLCDEPTGDLDLETGKFIIDLLKKINQSEKKTIIIVTHDQKIANQTDIIYRISDGQILKIDYPKPE